MHLLFKQRGTGRESQAVHLLCRFYRMYLLVSMKLFWRQNGVPVAGWRCGKTGLCSHSSGRERWQGRCATVWYPPANTPAALPARNLRETAPSAGEKSRVRHKPTTLSMFRTETIYTDRWSCFDGLHSRLEHLTRKTQVCGAAVHDTFIIVILRDREKQSACVLLLYLCLINKHCILNHEQLEQYRDVSSTVYGNKLV